MEQVKYRLILTGIVVCMVGVACMLTAVLAGENSATSAPSSSESASGEAAEFAKILMSQKWKDRNIRKAILEAVRVYGAKECGVIIANALADPDQEVRCVAIDCLKDYKWINDSHIDGLINNVKGEDAACRVKALGILGTLNDNRAMRVIITALEDSDSDMRSIALTCLAERHKQKIPDELLSSLIQDKDEKVRVACLRVVARTRPKGWEKYAICGLQDDKEAVKLVAVQLCVGTKISGLKVENLKSLLDSKDQTIRAKAVIAIPSCDNGNIEKLSEFLKDPSSMVRRSLVIAGGYVPAKEAAILFKELLNDQDRDVRLMVIRRIMKLEHDQIVSLLSQACLDKDLSVAIAAIEVLANKDKETASKAARNIYIATSSSATDKIRIINLSPQLVEPVATEVLWDAMHAKQENIKKSGIDALQYCSTDILKKLIDLAKENKDSQTEVILEDYLSRREKKTNATTKPSRTPIKSKLENKKSASGEEVRH